MRHSKRERGSRRDLKGGILDGEEGEAEEISLSPPPPRQKSLHRAISLSLDFLFSLLILLLSNVPSPLGRPHAGVAVPGPPRVPADPSPAAGTSAARALANVLFAVSRVPVSSRKYDLVRGLADRLIDGNLRSARDGAGAPALEGLNRVVLASAFAGTLHRLELAATAAATPRDRTKGGLLGAVRSRIRWSGAMTALMTAEDQTSGEGETPEKLAAEVLWLAQKMEECGAAGEAAAMWGAASRLGGLAVSAEPRLQVVLVQLSYVHDWDAQYAFDCITEQISLIRRLGTK